MAQKLLLADDSVTIQRVIELTFADEDVQVIAVGNGQEAIDRVQRDRPDIVLADVGMPERNGYEVAAFVKGNPATAHIPVVLLTGAFEPIDEGRARTVGCDGVLVKPFEPQIVISRVKELLAGKKPSGMWGSGPVAQGPVRQGAGDVQIPAGTSQGGASADPLEAYFDRLDAAFASTGTGPAAADPFASIPSAPAPAQASSDPFANVAPAPKREAVPLARRSEPAPPQASSKGAADPFADWDPDLAGDPARPAPREQPVAVAQKPVAPPAPEPVPVVRAAAPPPRPAVPVSAPPAPSAPFSPSAPTPSAPPTPSLVEAFAALLAAEERIGLKPSTATPSAPGRGDVEAPAITDEMIDEIAARVLARLSDESRPAILDIAERVVREEIERIKRG
jgi:CheY-like chemotaxis protein